MDFKSILWTAVAVIVALAAWELFVKKALKISSYEQAYERI